MRTEHAAEGFLRHRGLILVAAGGAVTEASLLTLVAPAARPLAPQVTAVPSLAAEAIAGAATAWRMPQTTPACPR
jgi:hypothetical protein